MALGSARLIPLPADFDPKFFAERGHELFAFGSVAQLMAGKILGYRRIA
jgi:hypothetical protein